jgi:hypothetical protein
MKRFRRWLFNGLVVLSLLLFGVSLLFWVLSYAKPWRANITASGKIDPYSWSNEREEAGWNVFSEFGYIDIRPFYSFFEWNIPYWKPVLLGLILPFYRFPWQSINCRAKRIRRGLCVNCGYDLRATPNRCPECGTAPSKKENVSN